MENKPLDWDLEDGIESVQLVLMKVKDLAGEGRVQIEVPAKSNMALHEYAREHFINRSLSVRLLKSQPLFLQAKPYLAHARFQGGSGY
jgi:hypothetical protein